MTLRRECSANPLKLHANVSVRDHFEEVVHTFYQILKGLKTKNRFRVIEIGAHLCLEMNCKGKGLKFSRSKIVVKKKKKAGTENSEIIIRKSNQVNMDYKVYICTKYSVLFFVNIFLFL